MTSLLRQIVAGPRLRHPEAGLDMCYVTDDIIATSGPSATYPQRAYRNPLDALVRFLDQKHGKNWCIWEFRAEGTGYPDGEVYGRIHHYPFPDHHPPPFALIPRIMAGMRNWLAEETDPKRVVVVHCKAGKGRSGTIACSYLMSEKGWKAKDALKQFTERRMRVGFGAGVSIPSQLRWIAYVDSWVNELNKTYVERPVEILEVHVWGLRDGVKVDIDGFVDEGRKIRRFHKFRRGEKTVMDRSETGLSKQSQKDSEEDEKGSKPSSKSSSRSSSPFEPVTNMEAVTKTVGYLANTSSSPKTTSVVLRPEKRVIVPTSDVRINFERRAFAGYTAWTVVTSIAHVWFNAYFEGGHKHDSGVFEVEWDALDGIKGTTTKGTRALDRLKVVWRYLPKETDEAIKAAVPGQPDLAGEVISEPAPGEPVPESHPADWRGEDGIDEDEEQELGEAPARRSREDKNKSKKEPKEDSNESERNQDTAAGKNDGN